ncbi:flagellar filament capping protein FliD [Pantoea brenneri]|uniref:flagellar filament capping protein FliD n=1 Tax=Pantoea brenneri TaxID=472694 RepID=UPI00289FDA43|nr:flagellar filament capping protein FliD [Pantoea brenneri]
MAISSIASAGVGGWDYTDLLNSMADSEQLRLNPYTNLQNSCKKKISAWGSIKNLTTNLQTSIDVLNHSAFDTMKVTSNTAFTATAASGALADTHTVKVDQLAIAHKLKSTVFDSAITQLGGTTSGGTRTITITQGNGDTDGDGDIDDDDIKPLQVELKDGETALNDIANLINKENTAKGGNVSASVQRDGNGGYQLMLSSKVTGTIGEMSISVEGDDSLGAILNTSNGGTGADKMSAVSAAKDAKFSVDGIDYTRFKNSISDVIDGVTLNLNAVSAADSEPEQLTLTVDTSAIKAGLQDFVKQYNALLTEATADSKYVAPSKDGDSEKTTEQSGALRGESWLRNLVSDIRNAVNGSYKGNIYTSLSQLGITTDSKTGLMTLDETKVDKAIADNPEDVQKMIQGVGGNGGLNNRLGEIFTQYLVGNPEKNIKGVFEAATDLLNSQIDNATDQITRTQALIDSKVELLRKQYANADSLFNQMNNMSTTLAGMFSKL